MPTHTLPLAAIDAGSNGIRLLLASLHQDGTVHIHDQKRYPVRIGHDAFQTGILCPDTLSQVTDAFIQIRRRLDRHQVQRQHFRAIATSALRHTRNAQELISRVELLTHIPIEIISAQEEAELGFLAISKIHDLKNKNAMIIDLGGGSLELTTAARGTINQSISLPLGPVRILSRQEQTPGVSLGKILAPHLERVQEIVHETRPDIALATGGNIKTMLQLSRQLYQNPCPDGFSFEHTQRLIQTLEPMSIAQRIGQLGLRTDRADLILIATQVIHQIMKATHTTRFTLSQAGLKEGVIYALAQAFKK